MTQVIGQGFHFGHLLDDLIQNDGIATTPWFGWDAAVPPPIDASLAGPVQPSPTLSPSIASAVTTADSVAPDINVGTAVFTETSAAGVVPGVTVVTNSTTFTNGTATATSASDLNALIKAADSLTSGTVTIDISGSIPLNTLGTVANGESLAFGADSTSGTIVTLKGTPDIAAINLKNGVSLVIAGSNNATLDGKDTVRGLFAYAGNVTISNLTLQNMVAQGGAGGNGANAGGGGAGLGGGLFVGPTANVTLNSVAFSGNQAIGGAGGDNIGGGFAGSVRGGGGGLGGAGGMGFGQYSAGGGGVGRTAFGGEGSEEANPNTTGTDDTANAGKGIIYGAAGGGHGESVKGGVAWSGGNYGGGGGSAQQGVYGVGGVLYYGAGAGGGGVAGKNGYTKYHGGSTDTHGGGGPGGFGGGGGGGYYNGGSGGFGGGGGGGTYTYGGNGGFGGGGGGVPNTTKTLGQGGFGAGNGGGGPNIGNYGTDGLGASESTYKFSGGGSGGGGLGAGGNIFVASGGILTFGGAATINTGAVTGGAAGVATLLGTVITSKTQIIDGEEENGFNTDGTAGSAYGSDIFIQNNSTSVVQGITFNPGSGQLLTLSGQIADEKGSGGTGANATEGKILAEGGGTIRLTGSNSFTGGSSIGASSTLDLGGSIAAGSGAISFTANTGRLTIEAAAQSNGTAFSNSVSGFVAGDVIDLSGLTFHAGATAHIVSNTLTVISNGVTDTVAVPGASANPNLIAVEDSGTGTMAEVHNPPTITTGGTVTFDGGGAAVTADSGLTISDSSSTTLASAQVVLGGSISGDVLTVGTAGGLVTSFSSGTLTLTGTALLATYQTALESVQYGFTANGDPTGGGHTTRTLSWSVNDGIDVSNTGTSTVDTVHVAPTVVAGATANYVGGGLPSVLDAGLTVTDPDSGGNLIGAAITISSGFATGDALNFAPQNGIAESGFNSGTLTLTGTATIAQYETALESITYSSSSADPTLGHTDIQRTIVWSVTDGVVASNSPASSLDVTCYRHDTRIMTDHGEVAVQDLRIGDRVATLSGEARPIRWIGWRHFDLTRHPAPELVRPVAIRAGAFADCIPRRDLFVSPDHALLIDDALVMARLLVNGSSIARDTTCQHVTYYHVELETHDILLAEGLPAESYLDTGNRGMFENAGVPLILHPNLDGGQRQRVAASCRAFVDDAARTELIWRRLATRAAALGFDGAAVTATTNDPGLLVVMDGLVLKPVSTSDGRYTFVLPRVAGPVRLVSRTVRPCDLTPWILDDRRLGVAISRLTWRSAAGTEPIALDHPDLSHGWWDVESNRAALWRWTDGNAVVPLSGPGPVMLMIEVAGVRDYPLRPAREIPASQGIGVPMEHSAAA